MSQVTNSRAALVLADEERQRKRERDRLYQKRKRERDRTLISKLKQRVETVESRLETAALPSLVSPYSERRPQSDNESDTKTSTTHCSTTCPVLSTTGDDTSGELMTGCANEGHNDNNSGRIRCISREIMQSEFPDTITEFLSPQCFPIEPSFVTADAEQQQEQPLRPDHWTTLSSLFLEAARPDEFSSLYEFQTFDSHVIITGVVHGWSEVANTFKLTPLLECLRNVDELALAYSGIVERMAALRIIALLIRSQKDTQGQLMIPPYLWARPSQLAVDHPKLIDYFIWPGFRERMVFFHSRYTGDNFVKQFSESYKFIWEGSPSDVYERIPNTPLYGFTAKFLECSGNIERHRMNHDFLNAFPEFYGDVPVTGGCRVVLPSSPPYNWTLEPRSDADGKEDNGVTTPPWNEYHDSDLCVL